MHPHMHLNFPNETVSEVAYSDTVVVVVTVVLAIKIAVSLFLNILLLLILQYSPSLKTPPNTNLTNICINNLLLCVDMLICALCISFNSLKLPSERSELLSGIQLFLTYNGLLQYWGSFASIGYYRHRTLKKPRLTLKHKRQLVKRCVVFTWVLSVILSITLSASFVPSSQFALSTLDPFMRNYYNMKEDKPSYQEHVAISLVIVVAFTLGLAIILKAYFSIWRSIRGMTSVGRNRVLPRPNAFTLSTESSDLTLSTRQAYRPQYTISSNTIGGNLSRAHKDTFVVAYDCKEKSVAVHPDAKGDNRLNNNKSQLSPEGGRVRPLSSYGQRRPLQTSWSTISNCSIKSKTQEFTDISIGADLLRFQREQTYSLSRRYSFRPQRLGMGSAIRNSVAMFIVYLVCSVPLIVLTCPIPGVSSLLSPVHRLHMYLLCRLLFFFNGPVYPLWYLTFSVTVRKCLGRLWEGLTVRWKEDIS